MDHRGKTSWRDGTLPRIVSGVAEPLFGTERHEAWVRGDWWPRYLALAAALAAIILCRRLDVVQRPQFWAEDGSIYFCDALVLGFPRAVLQLYRGFPHLAQRLIAAFGSLFPIAAAPRVYTTAAIVVEALSVATFSLPRFRHLVGSDVLRALFCVACVSLPADVEVFATPANVGWFLGLWLLLVSLSTAPRGTRSLIRLATSSVVAIVSTPIAVLLAPLWLLRISDAVVRGKRRELVFGSTLLAAFGLLFLTTPHLGAEGPLALRVPGHDAPMVASFHWVNLEIASARIVMTLVMPQAMLNEIATSGPYILHLSATVVLGLLVGAAAVEGRRRLVPGLCGLSLMVGAVGLLLIARPGWNVLMQTPEVWHSMPGRYAMFPIACAMLCVVVVLDGIAKPRPRMLATCVACAVVMLAWWPTFAIAPLPDLDWPQWAARLQTKLDARSREPLVIPTAPWWKISIDAAPPSGSPQSSDRCAGSTNHERDAGAAPAP